MVALCFTPHEATRIGLASFLASSLNLQDIQANSRASSPLWGLHLCLN